MSEQVIPFDALDCFGNERRAVDLRHFDALAQRCRELEAEIGQYRGIAYARVDECAALRAEIADLKARLLEAERGNEELVRLRAENRRLSDALAPFAKCAELFDDDVRSCNMPNSGPFYSWPRRHHEYELTVENLRDARSTLEASACATTDGATATP